MYGTLQKLYSSNLHQLTFALVTVNIFYTTWNVEAGCTENAKPKSMWEDLRAKSTKRHLLQSDGDFLTTTVPTDLETTDL